MSVSVAIVYSIFEINYDEISSTLPFECKSLSQAWNVSISVAVHGVSTRILDPLLLLWSAFSPSRRQVRLLPFDNRSFALPLISIVVVSRHSLRKLRAIEIARKLEFISLFFLCRISCNTGKVCKSSIFPTWCRDKCHQMTLPFGGQRMSWKQGAMAFC